MMIPFPSNNRFSILLPKLPLCSAYILNTSVSSAAFLRLFRSFFIRS
jgi:hypothetical protein